MACLLPICFYELNYTPSKIVWCEGAETFRLTSFDTVTSAKGVFSEYRFAGIFPNERSYVYLVTTYLMEYAEDWSVFRTCLIQESFAATLLVVT